jgi:hypothetical protein
MELLSQRKKKLSAFMFCAPFRRFKNEMIFYNTTLKRILKAICKISIGNNLSFAGIVRRCTTQSSKKAGKG